MAMSDEAIDYLDYYAHEMLRSRAVRDAKIAERI